MLFEKFEIITQEKPKSPLHQWKPAEVFILIGENFYLIQYFLPLKLMKYN